MHRRLYFLVNDPTQASQIFEKLLLARVSDRYIHFLANEDTPLGDLPAATTFQKSDISHSLVVGLCIGAVIGVIAGFIGHGVLNVPIGGVMIATTAIGAVLGAWSSSMIGMMVPNRHLKAFYPAIEAGQILAIVDVPLNRVEEIKATIKRTIAHASFAGIEPTVPSVP